MPKFVYVYLPEYRGLAQFVRWTPDPARCIVRLGGREQLVPSDSVEVA